MFRIYIEGGLSAEVKSRKKAEALRTKYENEGWNVTVTKVVQTIIGSCEVTV